MSRSPIFFDTDQTQPVLDAMLARLEQFATS